MKLASTNMTYTMDAIAGRGDGRGGVWTESRPTKLNDATTMINNDHLQNTILYIYLYFRTFIKYKIMVIYRVDYEQNRINEQITVPKVLNIHGR